MTVNLKKWHSFILGLFLRKPRNSRKKEKPHFASEITLQHNFAIVSPRFFHPTQDEYVRFNLMFHIFWYTLGGVFDYDGASHSCSPLLKVKIAEMKWYKKQWRGWNSKKCHKNLIPRKKAAQQRKRFFMCKCWENGVILLLLVSWAFLPFSGCSALACE